MEIPRFCAYDCIIIKGHVFSLVEDTALVPCKKCKLREECKQYYSECLCFIHSDNPAEYYSEVGEVLVKQVKNANGSKEELLTIDFY